MKEMLPEKTVERLSQFRRLLLNIPQEEKKFIFSHEIAKLLHLTPVQVRRDLMLMGYSGSPSKGYDINKMIASISKTIDSREGQNIAIIGMGNLGNAILKYMLGKREKLNIVATFDIDEKKINRCAGKVTCYPLEMLSEVIKSQKITIGIITVSPEAAVDVKNRLIEAGIKGIINFTPTPLNVPDHVFLEEFDIITSLEKAAYFVKH